MSEPVRAQVQCYCGHDSDGHLWNRPLCPPKPTPWRPPAFSSTAEERQRAADDAALADLFRRALRAGLITAQSHFRPSFHTTLEPGNLIDAGRVELSDAETDVLRRSV